MRRTHIIVKARFTAPLANPTRSRRCTPCADEASCRRHNTGLRQAAKREDDARRDSGYKARPLRGVANRRPDREVRHGTPVGSRVSRIRPIGRRKSIAAH